MLGPVELPPTLHFSNDSQPGYTRTKRGKAFRYLDTNGEPVKDRKILERIESLVIPPAWTNVWICKSPSGHMQASGRDQKGRKQTIYHPEWHRVRSEQKFEQQQEIGQLLPKVRRAVEERLQQRGLSRDRVLAAVVSLLESTMIRVGNARYVVENEHYGLTPLKNDHVHVISDRVEFRFVGKSGKAHEITLKDKTLSRIVRQCQELPEQHLFAYLDEEGTPHTVSSTDVNSFLQAVAGCGLTAKEFRTWGGTIEAIRLMREIQPKTPREVTKVVKEVAKALGNTAAVCRQHYIHPKVLEVENEPAWLTQPLPRKRRYLNPYEVLFLESILGD